MVIKDGIDFDYAISQITKKVSPEILEHINDFKYIV